MLYLSFGDVGVFDISDPEQLQLISRIDVPGSATTIAFENNKVYVGNTNNWIGIFDVSSPNNPSPFYDEQLGAYQWDIAINQLAVINNHIYFEVDHPNYAGLQVCHYEQEKGFVMDGYFESDLLKISQSGVYGATRRGTISYNKNKLITNVNNERKLRDKSFLLYQNHPNPFNSSTKIKFTLEKSGYILLNIYNIKGQKVKTLLDGHVAEGSHIVHWDGTNDSGKQCSSGIFICRLQQNNKSFTKKIMCLK